MTTDTGLDRTPPSNRDAEEAVLGGMMMSRDAIIDVQHTLTGSDFYWPIHATIFAAICDLHDRSEPADPITVGALLEQTGDLERVGGRPYLFKLTSSVVAASSADYYASIVHEKALLRRLAQAGNRITEMSFAGEGETRQIIEAAQAELAAAIDIRDDDLDAGFIGDGMDDYLDELEKLQKGGRSNGVLTGFVDLDALTTGLHGGQVIVVAARPAMGKSTLALDFARNCAIGSQQTAAFFSLEMPKDELRTRAFSAEGRIALHHMRNKAGMTDDDWTRLAKVTPMVSGAPLFIDAGSDQTVMSIKAKCRRLKQRNDLRLIVIDYLQLLNSGLRRVENRQTEVAGMSRSLKLLAKELDVPVVVLSQLNRGPEQRSDKKPMLSDLRESGAIEQDADIVILLHREDAYDKESPRAGEADLIVAKHRNGSQAIITVAFQGHYSRFVDMATEGSLA